jgi:AcrR family transcriptional regulator
MPQVLKEDVRVRIVQSALQQFYDKGYKFATMKNIAANCEVPTGLIYSYYTNKAELFRSVVAPVLAFIETIEAHPDPTSDSMDRLFEQELPQLMGCINRYHKQLVILIDKSLGSPLADTKDQVIQNVALHLRTSPILRDTNFDEVFYHILATNFMEGIFEIARHYVDKAWAEKMLHLLVQLHIFGVSGLSG